jgi:phosphoenolpyruvate phosphomutase
MQGASRLRVLLAGEQIIKLIGAHDALGALLAERAGFDGVWSSGLEISTSYGVPDANILSMSEFLSVAERMASAVSIPVVADCDTGFGNSNNVIEMVRRYEAAGIAGVSIEDKLFPKVNSFIPGRQDLASIPEFVGKIMAAKNAQRHDDFMVIARVEALIAGWGLEEALKRSEAYRRAGADAILIHSKSKLPDEILEFIRIWGNRLPLVIVPTTYFAVPASEWQAAGVKMVIYANHGLRSAIKSVSQTFSTILETGSTAAVENEVAPMKEVFEIQGMNRMKENEDRFLRTGDKVVAIIAAAGDHLNERSMTEIAAEIPIAMIDVNGKSLLERQMQALGQNGIHDVHVVGGYKHDKLQAPGIKLHRNENWEQTGELQSLLCAGVTDEDRVIVAYSDILFDAAAIAKLLRSDRDITLLIDGSYHPDQYDEGRKVDLVVTGRERNGKRRGLHFEDPVRVERLGLRLSPDDADAEFAGLVLFSRQGWKALLQEAEHAGIHAASGAFHEAPCFSRAALTDLIQELIDKKHDVFAVQVQTGWLEIHSFEDYKDACRMVRS